MSTPRSTAEPVMRVSRISKRFGTTKALDDVSLTLHEGEVRALLGRNGAGKSTLIAAITGLLEPDEGGIEFTDPDLAARGVACVYQKSTLIPHLTAAENVFIDTYPRTRLGTVSWRATSAQARALLAEWGADALTDRLVSDLDPLQRKVVEICRALATGSRILLLDEPTAGLDGDATRTLFERMRTLTGQGISIVYVSHYLDEVFEVCDTATVLRDGAVVHTGDLASLTMAQLVNHMVGGERAEIEAPITATSAIRLGYDPLLEVEGMRIPDRVDDFGVTIMPGECVGLVGLEGSGIMEVGEAIAGLRTAAEGRVRVNGGTVPPGSVIRAIRSGIGFLPGDRHKSGFVPDMSNEENATLSVLDRLKNRIGLIDARERHSVFEDLWQSWEIKVASAEQSTAELSGGNQQKIALARAFASRPDVLILANPTAGVDVSAKASIIESISSTVHETQTACLIISSDESEFQPCSRVLVMFRGEIIGELRAPWAEQDLAAAVQGELSNQELHDA